MSELDGIYEHLNELRTRVLRVVIVVGIYSCISDDISS